MCSTILEYEIIQSLLVMASFILPPQDREKAGANANLRNLRAKIWTSISRSDPSQTRAPGGQSPFRAPPFVPHHSPRDRHPAGAQQRVF